MADLITLNQLVRQNGDIYVPAGGTDSEFAYSDGAESEQYLYQVLSQARDLSSRSSELQRKIIDWPSEYHLTGNRSNLLRPFNLDSVSRVLELGSGCGAITRYLGEQGKQVDAVEGSKIRAGLGKLRCRELENVRVINANYNELEIPENHYDLILFVGVIEYARKFSPDAANDWEAARTILQHARTCLKPNGVILVAIENRLGLKYMLGAHEDHYAKRYIGINGYRNSAGIATYSRLEWEQLIGQAGFAQKAFSFPFPDYKVPSVVLSDHYLSDNPFAFNHLEGLISRDYFAPQKRSSIETICWHAASHGGFIRDIANSFCILLGNQDASIERIQGFDFCHGPGGARDNRFAVTTHKPVDQDVVIKTPEFAQGTEGDQGVRQQLEPQKFLRGTLLSAQWLRTLLTYVGRQEFETELREYYNYLVDMEHRGALSIDLLPINIIVDQQGEWEIFDQEWEVEWPLTKEYIFFRALFTFVVGNWEHLKDYLGWLELQTVRDFIEYGFNVNMIHFSEHMDQCIALEDRFQKVIARDRDSQDVTELLTTVFDFSERGDVINSRLYWTHADNGFNESNNVKIEISPDPAVQSIRFNLPPGEQVSRIRFDPMDIQKSEDEGFYQVCSLQLIQNDGDADVVKWRLSDPQAIAEACVATSAVFCVDGDNSSWIAVTDFPKMEFKLPAEIQIDFNQPCLVDVELRIIRTMEYALAYNRYLVATEQAEKSGKRAQKNLHSMKMINQYMVSKIASLEQNLEKTNHDYSNTKNRLEKDLAITRSEIETIKAGKPFRVAAKVIGLINILKPTKSSD